MRRRRRFSGFAATCCMAAALSALPGARALALVDSIEAMVADADVVAVATVADVWRVTDPETPLKARAVLRLGDVIKGDASPGDLTVVVPSSFEGSFNQWKLLGGKKLVFLVRADRAAWHPPGKVYPWALRTHGWTLRENFAAGPRNLPAGVSLPDDVAPARGVVAFTVDLRPIYELDEAIAAARQSAARTVADATYVQFTMPEGCALREASPAFAHEILRIPVDDRAEAAAQRWAADPSYGEQTAAVLTHFDSDRNAAILTRLLDHPQRVASGRAGKMVTWSYPVRERAHRALERRGRATTPARLIGPRDFYRPLGASDLVTLAAFAALPVAGIVVFRRQRRRAAGVPSAVLPPAPRRFPTYAIVLAAAFMALVWLDRSSRTVVREVTASTGGSRLWLSAYGGGLQLVRIVAWPKEQPLSYGRFDLRDAPATLWNEADVFPADDRRFAGFRRLNGSMFGSARGATYPYHCVTIPVALVAALAGLLPAWHGVALLRDRSLRRSRAARGCCAACGYDLRGRDRQTTARCPECGTTASIAAVRSSRVSQYP